MIRATPAASEETQRINFSWLVRLRWATIAGQLGTILIVHYWMAIRLNLEALLLTLALEALTNVAASAWLRVHRSATERVLALTMGIDVLFLTVLLFLTGGSFNPFSFLYLVHIALAAVVLSPRWTWTLVALSLTCSALLFYGEGALGLAQASPHTHAEQMAMHMQGMWVAFGVAAIFIVYFVSRIRRALASRETDLANERVAAGRNERLASLATLAAGAAHELATPLGTIAVAAREIERRADQLQPARSEDARLIRTQVDRCRGILDRLAADAGASAGEAPSRMPLRQILDAAMRDTPSAAPVEIGGTPDVEIVAPPRALAQAIRAVLKNGQEAAPGTPLALLVTADGIEAHIVVRDLGDGMDEHTLARVGEPFFTTKSPGQGMGLGLFLATTVIEKLGGRLAVKSRRGQGTEVTVDLPLPSKVCLAPSVVT
jgi:two-component system sensor histidine kinase RegB